MANNIEAVTWDRMLSSGQYVCALSVAQRVKKRGHIAGLWFRDAHVWHRIAGHNALRITQPFDEIAGIVVQHAGDVNAVAERGERWADVGMRIVDSRNRMAANAAEVLHKLTPANRIAACDRLEILLSLKIAANEHNERDAQGNAARQSNMRRYRPASQNGVATSC
jgi:hypothetical protein